MVIVNKLVNVFRKDKEWSEAWRYKKSGVRRDEYDGRDYIYNIPTPVMDVKCDYYRNREKVKSK